MKKQYYLILIAVLASSSMMAQSFIYYPVKDVVETLTSPNYAGYRVDFTTSTPEAIQYDYQMISNTLPGWSFTLCVHTHCYSGLPSSGSMIPITLLEAQNGQTGYFSLTMSAGQNYGQGVLKYYVYDSNDINRGDTVTFTLDWDGTTTGVGENQNNSVFSLYPNPAKKNVTLSNNSNNDININIYDAMGKIVIQEIISTNNTTNLSLEELKSGIYFVSYIESDKILKSEKLIIQ